MITHRPSRAAGLSSTPVSKSAASHEQHGDPGWRSAPVWTVVA